MLSVQVVSPSDVAASAPKAKRGRSIVVTYADSWGSLSVTHLESFTGCSVDAFAKGASHSVDWNGRYWDLLRGAVQQAGEGSLLYMSQGLEEVWPVPGHPQFTTEQARTEIALLVNRIHGVRKLPVVHPSYDASFLASPTGMNGEQIFADPTVLDYPALYEFVDLTDLGVTFIPNDPLHLDPESYALRVEATWARSTLAQNFGTCGA